MARHDIWSGPVIEHYDTWTDRRTVKGKPLLSQDYGPRHDSGTNAESEKGERAAKNRGAIRRKLRRELASKKGEEYAAQVDAEIARVKRGARVCHPDRGIGVVTRLGSSAIWVRFYKGERVKLAFPHSFYKGQLRLATQSRQDPGEKEGREAKGRQKGNWEKTYGEKREAGLGDPLRDIEPACDVKSERKVSKKKREAGGRGKGFQKKSHRKRRVGGIGDLPKDLESVYEIMPYYLSDTSDRGVPLRKALEFISGKADLKLSRSDGGALRIYRLESGRNPMSIDVLAGDCDVSIAKADERGRLVASSLISYRSDLIG